MMKWEKRAVVAHIFLAILLAGVFMKAGSWFDEISYQDGDIKATAIDNYRAAVGAELVLIEKPHKRRRRGKIR